jgi:TolA-binding protein
MGLASTEGWVATIASAKEWLKNYATDEKTPEVLFLLANAYAAMLDNKNAEYYYKLLIEDYSQLEISKKAMLALADLRVKSQNYKPALALYRNVLYSTKDLDTASAAAYKATETYLTIKEPDGAREYFGKLIKGNLSYVLQNKGKAFELATRLANAEIYKEAIELGEALLNNMDKSDPNYAKLIYLISTWYDKSGNIESAKQYYMRYLSEFPDGINAKDAQNRLDAIVFAQTKPEDENAVKVYSDTIKKYQGDDIAKRALAQKAAVLYKANRCEEYLQDLAEISKLPKDLLLNEAKMTLECKQKVAFEKLSNADCKSALEMIDTNKLVVPGEYSQPLFNCYLEQTRFKDAINLSYNEAKKGTGKDRLTWLANYEKALLTKQDYKVAIAVAADAIKLANALNINGFEWLWIDKFNAA